MPTDNEIEVAARVLALRKVHISKLTQEQIDAQKQTTVQALTAAEQVRGSEWQPIETAPKDGREVLLGFQGQFTWISFVGNAYGKETTKSGYAAPTHWVPLPAPPTSPTK